MLITYEVNVIKIIAYRFLVADILHRFLISRKIIMMSIDIIILLTNNMNFIDPFL